MNIADLISHKNWEICKEELNNCNYGLFATDKYLILYNHNDDELSKIKISKLLKDYLHLDNLVNIYNINIYNDSGDEAAWDAWWTKFYASLETIKSLEEE